MVVGKMNNNSQQWFLLSAKITSQVPFQVLIDSGAEQSFLDHDLATELDTPLGELPEPLQVRVELAFRTSPPELSL